MPAGAHSFHVGSIGCTVLSDGYFSYPAAWFFSGAGAEEFPRESVLTPYTCLLIQSGRHVVLVDTGAGPALQTSGAILARLEAEGIRPRDVDTVVLTHGHADHIGGAVDARGRPAFPQARYLVSEREHEFWMHSRPDLGGMRVPDPEKLVMVETAHRCFTLLRHQLEFLDGETEIIPGVRTLPAPGHTPGHLALLVSSEGRQFLNLGDAAMHPLHLAHPGWQTGLDQASEQAAATRCALAERVHAEGMQVMAFHFPFPSVGKLADNGAGGWTWSPWSGL
jgi:glyoxylase-like metal-dependent hydrolase (beta-lactamase superfamily II)